MKKRSTKNIFLISLISIFLLVFNILVKKYLFIYAESIMASFMLVILVLSIQMFGLHMDRNNPSKNNLLCSIAQVLAAYFIIIYLLGLYFGYSKIVFALNPLSILNNTLAPIVIFICLEVFRYIVTNNNRDNNKKIIFFNFIIGLIELSISTKYLHFNNLEMAYKSIADYIIPVAVKQLALGTLCYHGGLKPLFLYRGVMLIYTYLVPIQPTFNETIICVCNILLPVLLLIKTNDVIEGEKEEKIVVSKKNNIFEYIVGTVIVAVVLIVISGVSPIGITAIASDSMHPTFSKGAGVITLKIEEEDLKEGDIISFAYDNKIVVHRIDSIVEEDGEIRYITKGDANSSIDEGYVTYKDIKNKVILSIPLIGYPAIIVGEMLSR